MGFYKADCGFVYDGSDLTKYGYVAVGGIGAVCDDGAGTVLDGDSFAAEEFQREFFYVQGAERDLAGVPEGSVEAVAGSFEYA